MPMDGRITGRKSADGQAYELVQRGTVRQSIPLAEVRANPRLKRAINKHGWEPL